MTRPNGIEQRCEPWENEVRREAAANEPPDDLLTVPYLTGKEPLSL